MTTYLIGAYAVNPEYVDAATYTVFSFLSGLAALNKLSAYYQIAYGLEEGIIIDGEGNPVAVYFFDQPQWLAFLGFSVTDAFICESPCKLLTFSL